MRADMLARLSDSSLLHRLQSLVGEERASTAVLVACIAEVDARQLFRAEGHPSMHSYCVHVLHLSESAAFQRITAARLVRQFPAVHSELAQGLLHLTAIKLLDPPLTTENAVELLQACEHKTKAQIEEFLARRFPRTDLLPMVVAAPGMPSDELTPRAS